MGTSGSKTIHTHTSRQTLKLHLLTVNTHHHGNLHFLHHGCVRFKNFNNALWVAVLCEASEATPTVAEASEASRSYELVLWYGQGVAPLLYVHTLAQSTCFHTCIVLLSSLIILLHKLIPVIHVGITIPPQ